MLEKLETKFTKYRTSGGTIIICESIPKSSFSMSIFERTKTSHQDILLLNYKQFGRKMEPKSSKYQKSGEYLLKCGPIRIYDRPLHTS